MITYKDVENKVMPPEKKISAKNDILAYYVGRKISYLMTIPLLYTSITPNTVTWISVLMLLVGFVLFCLVSNIENLIYGWLFFLLWNLLDGVDGNIARYKSWFSKLGEAYDAMGGYAAIALIYLATGIAASHFPGLYWQKLGINNEWLIILGALSSLFGLFPRLMLHKIATSLHNFDLIKDLKGNGKIGVFRLIAINISSITGGVMLLLLFAVIYRFLDVFTVFYCILNALKMILALHILLKKVEKNENISVKQ